jgi:hypothetical protein
MKKQYIIIALITILIIGAFAAYKAIEYAIYNKIDYVFNVLTVDQRKLAISDLVQSGYAQTKIKTSTKLINHSILTGRLKDFTLYLYYKGQLVGKTSAEQKGVYTNDLLLEGNRETYFVQDFDLFISNVVLDIAADYLRDKTVRFEYTAKFRYFGIPITYQSTYSL